MLGIRSGEFSSLPLRDPLSYHVVLVLVRPFAACLLPAEADEEVLCGVARENLGGHAVALNCPEELAGRPVRAVIVHSKGMEPFALCEFELLGAQSPLLHV